MTLVEVVISVVLLSMITGADRGRVHHRVQRGASEPTTGARVERRASHRLVPRAGRPVGRRKQSHAPAPATQAWAFRRRAPHPTARVRAARSSCGSPGASTRTSATSKLWVANYYFDASAHTLVRKTCVDGAHGLADRARRLRRVDRRRPRQQQPGVVHRSQWIRSAVPDFTRGDPSRSGSGAHHGNQRGERAAPPYDYTLTASLRPQSQLPPDPAQLDTRPAARPRRLQLRHPGIDLQGSPDVVVYGGVMINNSCNPIEWDPAPTSMRRAVSRSPTTPVADPYASLTPPPVDCVNGTHSGSQRARDLHELRNVQQRDARPRHLHLLQRRDVVEQQSRPTASSSTSPAAAFDGSNAAITASPHDEPAVRHWWRQPRRLAGRVQHRPRCRCAARTRASADFDGTIYAPAATVQLKNADMRIRQVIALPGALRARRRHATARSSATQPTCPVSLDTTEHPGLDREPPVSESAIRRVVRLGRLPLHGRPGSHPT